MPTERHMAAQALKLQESLKYVTRLCWVNDAFKSGVFVCTWSLFEQTEMGKCQMALVAVLQACDLPKSACMLANNKIHKTLQFSTEF